MGKQSGQIQMVILDIDSMIPENHLLRQIKNCVNFDFIYEKAALWEIMDEELGYSKYDYRNKDTDNSRNGHSQKTMHTMGNYFECEGEYKL